MADKKRRGGGSKLIRSETVTIRLDPKLRYLASLAARKQHRTLSSFIEWTIAETLKHIALRDFDEKDEKAVSVAVEAESLWDVDEADRFAKLAMSHPEMLNHHEQIVWKLVRENGHLWRGREDTNGVWQWYASPETLIPKRLRENWDLFNEVASGEKEQTVLPRWSDMPTVDVSDISCPF